MNFNLRYFGKLKQTFKPLEIHLALLIIFRWHDNVKKCKFLFYSYLIFIYFVISLQWKVLYSECQVSVSSCCLQITPFIFRYTWHSKTYIDWILLLLQNELSSCEFSFLLKTQNPETCKMTKIMSDILDGFSLLTHLTFIALPILWKIYVVDSFSLVWVIMQTFNLNHVRLEEWSMDNNMVSKIWVGISNAHLLQFKVQSHKKCGLWILVPQNSY